MYASPNNSTTSLSDNDDDDVKDMQLSVYPYYPVDVAPAQWSSPTTRGPRPKTPPHSPASRLPPEILIHILRQLHTTRDLHNAILVSRSWCQCAVELLWHRPSFTDTSRFVQMLQVICSDEKTFDYARFVRRLNFVCLGRELTDGLFVRLGLCVKLERLTLVNCVEITDEALSKVLPLCSNLVALDLTNINSCSDNSIIALAKSATKLQGINLGGCKNITDEGVLALATHCSLLRRIKLGNVKSITDKAVSALAKQCPLLLEIDLNGCPKVTDQAVRDLWTYSTHLRDFRLSQCTELTDAAFPANPQTTLIDTQLGIQPFPNMLPGPTDGLPPLRLTRLCEHLRMLDLTSDALITDDAIAGIIAVAPKIRNIVLAKCSQLTDAGVESICKLGKHLHYLHLGHAAAITDVSMRILARSCTRLRYVDLACCPLLTDMSVFELSGLPKLRRIGLVRVTQLTDQAIFSLADRHSTLERIHLSYCENITVLAIHFLLQRLNKLTHLSLTGIPAFRRTELQKYCRSPPREFNTNQRAAFCVYSGKGVNDLRNHLAEMMAHVHAATDEGDNETDYDAEEDDDSQDLAMYRDDGDRFEHGPGRIGHLETVETPRVAHMSERANLWRIPTGGTVIAREELFEDEQLNNTLQIPPTITIRGRTLRNLTAEGSALPRLPVEETNPSSLATTPSPTVQPTSRIGTPSYRVGALRARGFGNDPIVEPQSPSPQLPAYPTRNISHYSHGHPRSSSRVSDDASVRSAHSSGTNNTNTSASNGAAFFRSFHGSGPGLSSSEAAIPRAQQGGMYTPDLIFAEMGHGRGHDAASIGGAGPGPSTMMQSAAWHSESSASSPNDDTARSKNDYVILDRSDADLRNGEGRRPSNERERGRPPAFADNGDPLLRPTASHGPSPWPTHREQHDPASPIPYLSSSPTTRELQESVHSALAGSSSSAGMIAEDAMVDGRGRSVKRSLRNTLNAAEQYASALFFGRSTNGSASASSSARDRLPGGSSAGGSLNGRGPVERQR